MQKVYSILYINDLTWNQIGDGNLTLGKTPIDLSTVQWAELKIIISFESSTGSIIADSKQILKRELGGNDDNNKRYYNLASFYESSSNNEHLQICISKKSFYITTCIYNGTDYSEKCKTWILYR